jgi:hypothetical protein
MVEVSSADTGGAGRYSVGVARELAEDSKLEAASEEVLRLGTIGESIAAGL